MYLDLQVTKIEQVVVLADRGWKICFKKVLHISFRVDNKYFKQKQDLQQLQLCKQINTTVEICRDSNCTVAKLKSKTLHSSLGG